MSHTFFTRPPDQIEKRTIGRGKTTTITIYSFLKSTHAYAESFGFQWKRYAKVQIDRFNGTKITKSHLEQLLGFPLSKLKNQTVLEIGSGAGRYTDLFRTLAHHVITVDPSAIDSNVGIGSSSVTAVRADLFDLPIQPEKIDLVFCRGVLQHTQDPIAAIEQLCRYAKVGGLVAFDVYPRNWQSLFYTKYYLRAITKRLPKKQFAKFLERNIPWMLRLKVKFLNPLFPDIRFIREIPNIVFPIADYTRYKPLASLSFEQQVQWSILDTFDMYTPEFDTPLSFEEVLANLPKNMEVVRADRDQYHFVFKRVK